VFDFFGIQGRVSLKNQRLLARRTGTTDKNLIRALGPNGSPTAANLFQIIHACMKAEGLTRAAHVIRPNERSRPATE
jgi:DNA-binding phage protein